MHILLTNDDGPPSADASPYIAEFVKALTGPPFNHTVSVVVPTIQRSWIGKAHLLPPHAFPPIKGAVQNHENNAGPEAQQPPTHSKNDEISSLVTPRYYNPRTGEVSIRPPARPSSTSADGGCWVLVPGTPSTCVQLGLFHRDLLFPWLAPAPAVDLVVSGPNYGRNTTAAFALSSGTVGGALEAAVCGVRAVALSFAFYTRQETQDVISEGCVLGCRIIEALYRDWNAHGASAAAEVDGDRPWAKKNRAPDLYNVNIPLQEGISKCPVRWTWMLDNKWTGGSLYKVVEPGTEAQGGKGTDAAARNGDGVAEETTDAPLSFKWSPTFGDIWKTVENSKPGNDGLLMREKMSSVTPMAANYEGLYGIGSFEGDFKL